MTVDPDALRRSSVAEYLELMDSREWPELLATPLPYETVPAIEVARWHLPLIAEMVRDELREVTNQLNYWQACLRRWHSWNRIAAPMEQQTRWSMEWEWVEPVAFYCMFQPTASLDRFVFAATNAMHQAMLARKPGVKDWLLGDPKAPGRKATQPTRRQKREQLVELCKPWNAGTTFIAALDALDDDDHRAGTNDFRNRASHAIAPRFTVGQTNVVTRRLGPVEQRTEQPDGTITLEEVPGKLTVYYCWGGLEPLSMDDAWATNLVQFGHAKTAFGAYLTLLEEAASALSWRHDTA